MFEQLISKKRVSGLLTYLVLILASFYTNSYADDSPMLQRLELFNNQSPISPKLSFYRDNTQQLSFNQIRSPEILRQFTHTQSKHLTFDRSRDVYWFVFDIKTHLGLGALHLVSDVPAGTDSQLFVEKLPQNQLSNAYSRLHLAIPEYHLVLKPKQHYRFYFRVKHKRDIMRVQFFFMSHEEASIRSSLSTIMLTFLASGFLIVVFYNLLLSISLREGSYLNISLFAFVIALDLICKHNLFPWIPVISQVGELIYPMLGMIVVITIFNFLPYILSESLYSPFMRQLFHYIKIVCILLMPVAMLHPQGDALSFWLGLIIFAPLLSLVLASIYLKAPLARGGALMVVLLGIAWPATLLSETNLIDKPIYTDLLRYVGCLMAAILASLIQAAQARQFQQQAIQATALNRAKDEFLSTITHELRTPMQSVVGITELLQQGKLNSEQQQHTQQLLMASNHMLGLIDDILDFSQLENTKIKLNPAPFKLDQMLNSLEVLFSSPIQQKGLNFSVKTQGNLDNYLLGDEQRIKQVLVNLVGNALKYTERGYITLSVTTQAQEQNYQVSFKVCDTGIGISDRNQKRLFDAFYQVKRGRNRRYSGTGLGLAISQQLLQHMNSQLQVKSTLGRGSRFYFTITLPLASTAPTPQVTEVISENCLNSYAILVVDDIINANLSKAMLTKHGAIVNVAYSGEAAIQQIKQHAFDLIFMDISMPEMDGYETTRHMRRSLYHQTHPPIIALTAHAMSGERERCLEAGMNDYMTKPFTIENMINMALRWIKQKR